MAIRILVVDDASFIRDMIKKHLRDGIPGAQVYEATDGHRALAAFKAQRVDLILSDWEMPNMSGEELLKNLKEQPESAEVPFLMVTSRGDRSHVVKAIEGGAADYLVKPFTPEELLRKVNKQLARIGKLASAEPHAASQGFAQHSVNVLTGGRSSVAAQTGSQAKVKSGPKNKKLKGRAQLRFANQGESETCLLRELSTEQLIGLVKRTESLPKVFDQVVIDIESDQAEAPARLNGYVHSVQAAEAKPDTQFLRLVILFVDKDDEKTQALSRFIERL